MGRSAPTTQRLRRGRTLAIEPLEERSLLAANYDHDTDSAWAVAISADRDRSWTAPDVGLAVLREDVRREPGHRRDVRRLTRALHQALAQVATAPPAVQGFSNNGSPRGDFNGDGYVSRADVAVLTRNFGRTSGVEFADGDLDGDGVVGLRDVVGIVFGPGAFDVLSPRSTSPAPRFSWSASAGAVGYELTVESIPGCSGTHVVHRADQVVGTSVVVSDLPTGIYYACVTASDDVGNSVTASNSSWRFHVGAEATSVIADLPGLLAWWDAGFGVTADTNGGVQAWRDRSGNGNDLQQQTPGNRPERDAGYPYLNRQPTITFEKSASQFLSVPGAPLAGALSGEDRPYEVCIVYRRDGRPAIDGTFETLLGVANRGGVSNYVAIQQVTTSGWLRENNTRRDAAGTTTSVSTRPDIVGLGPMIRCDASSGTSLAGYAVGYSQNIDNDMRTDIRANVVQNVGPMSMDTISLGSLLRSTNGNFFDGAIAEVVVFGRRLSEAERLPLLMYFRGKYFPESASPTDVPGLVNHWDASALLATVGEPVDVWPDSAGGRDFVAAQSARPTVQLGPNGHRVLEFDGVDDAMISGSGGDWSLLHDGRALTAFVLYRVADANRETLEPLLDTVNDDPAGNAGFGLYYDNRIALGRRRRINTLVGAAAAAPVLNSTSVNNLVRPLEWEVVAIRREATVPRNDPHYVLFSGNQPIWGTNIGGSAPSTQPPNFGLTVGKLAGSDVFARIQVGEILIYDRTLSNYETQRVHEYLLRKWHYTHIAVAAGNGQPYINHDGYHRGFPTAAFDTDGALRIWYRRAADHGHSSGVTVEVTTNDGATFSPERVIYASPGYDIRVEGAATRLTAGPHAGRLIIAHNRSGPESQLLPATVELLYSDDNGASWSVVRVTEGDTEYDDWDGSAHTLFELNDGTLMLLYAGDKSTERRPNILKRISADGGLTWSPAVSIYNGAPDGVRAIEPNVFRRADGSLFLLFRDDTNQRILTMRSVDEGQTWTVPEFMFDGWGTPRMIADETGRLYVFYRAKIGSANSYRMVWRYSDDEGLTWAEERRFEFSGFGTMTYSYPIKDAQGNIWIVYGLESNVDSDIFLRLWHTAP